VRLFALIHDSKRQNEENDPDHGQRGADYAGELRGQLFQIPDEDFELLQLACRMHTSGHQHENPTIGTCWDSDRLDLGRVGMIPHSDYMSTEFGREIVDYGTITPWINPADGELGDTESHHLKFN